MIVNHNVSHIISHINSKRAVNSSKQKGVVLVVALVMLLIMTVAGVTTMTSATLQERIAGNQRQQMIARGNADRVLKQAEVVLDNLHTGVAFGDDLGAVFAATDDGMYFSVSFGAGVAQPLDNNFDRQDLDDWNSPANVNASVLVTDNDVTIGRYIIEYIGAANFEAEDYGLNGYDNSDAGSGSNNNSDVSSDRKVFRITAMGVGNNANVATILQSHYLEAAKY